MATITADEKSMPFIKNLASSDRKIRTTALSTLRTFLRGATAARQLSPLENLKLWKGLYYSLWMCDRPVPQQNLCAELAGLLDALPAHDHDAAAAWLDGFWETMGREWTGIDVLRMEKFLLLVRRVVGASFVWARKGGKKVATTTGADEEKEDKKTKKRKRTDWGRADVVLDSLQRWPFDATGDLKRVPVGLRLHVLDIWVDEAERAGMLSGDGDEDDDEDDDEAFLQGVKALVEALVATSPSRPVKVRARECLADERLPWNEADPEVEEGEGDANGADDDDDGNDGEEEAGEDGDDDDKDARGSEKDGWGGFED